MTLTGTWWRCSDHDLTQSPVWVGDHAYCPADDCALELAIAHTTAQDLRDNPRETDWTRSQDRRAVRRTSGGKRCEAKPEPRAPAGASAERPARIRQITDRLAMVLLAREHEDLVNARGELRAAVVELVETDLPWLLEQLAAGSSRNPSGFQKPPGRREKLPRGAAKAAILAAVEGGAVTPKAIGLAAAAALGREPGGNWSAQVSSALTALSRQGRVRKIGKGRYGPVRA